MTHPVIDDMNWRYTTKRYDPTRRVADEDLKVLLEAMRLSASSINSQPWKFIVVGSDEGKARLDKTFSEHFQFNRPHVYDSSHMILLAHNPHYTREDFAHVVDKGIADGRTKPEDRDKAFGAVRFVELNADVHGDTECWTRAQLYLALGNALHTLARLKIDSTCLEGIDSRLIGEEFAKELDGYICQVALAIGYRHPEDDYNEKLPKSRLSEEKVFLHL